jgi:hypothetical protein
MRRPLAPLLTAALTITALGSGPVCVPFVMHAGSAHVAAKHHAAPADDFMPLPAAAPNAYPSNTANTNPALTTALTLLAAPQVQPTAPPTGADRSATNKPAENEITPELDRSVTKGLAYLARHQNQDGSFGETPFGRGVAVTALASLAFMADGNVPGRGAYGENVQRGLNFILANCADNGLIATDQANSPMYGHGFATLFLGEVYGMTQGGGDTALADRVHKALIKAVRLIESSQNDEGGWRYNPVPFEADISVTITQIMALRSARNAGLEIPKATIDKAVEYVRGCQNPDGGFRYQMMAGPSGWPRSAAGVASLFYAGIYEDRTIDRGLRYLTTNGLPGGGGAGDMMAIHYFYGQYYAVQAMFLAGGDHWGRWWPAIRRELIGSQRNDGRWDDASVGSDYGTAMALIILQMPKRYLPIFQK